MKKKDVKVGGVYVAKVSGKVVDVRIDSEHQNGGWTATNLATKKQVRIKSAQRLRGKAGKAKGAPVSKKDTPAAKAPKTSKKAATAKHAASRAKMSGLDAAVRVLAEANEALSCKAIVERALEKGYWKTNGKTPQATVYAAIIREIQKKGEDARFKKTARGRFELARKEG